MNKFIIFLSLILLNCTTSSRMADNQTKNGHYRLYTYPEKLKDLNKFEKQRYKKIILVSSNDTNGMFNPLSLNIKNRFQEKRIITKGGVAAIKTYVDIFKKVYNDKVLYLDAGSFLNPQFDQQKAIFYANYLKPDVMALGHNELLNLARVGSNVFERLLSHLKVPYVSSNLFDLKQAQALKIKNMREHYIASVHNLKIGFISTINQEFAKNINSKLTNLYIQNETKAVLAKAIELRRKGVDIITLVTSSGVDCNSITSQQENLPASKVNFDPYEESQCALKASSLHKILESLPPETIDVVFTSGDNNKTANFISSHPVLQSSGQGQFLAWVELFYDTKLKRVDKKKTIIRQPVQLCHNFLKNTQDCYTKEDFSNSEITPAYFLGQKVKIKPLPRI